MAKGPNQKCKLLYLVKILEEKSDEQHPLSALDLIEKLSGYGVSAERKSIYDDIECLRNFGYDIVHKKSKGQSGYYLRSRIFSLPELKILVDVVQSARFITRAKSEELIKKLETFANHHEARSLRRQVYVASRIKSHNEQIYESVDKIHEAMQEGSQICFSYLDWNPDKKLVPRRDGEKYLVSPWSLAWSAENYYLIAYDEKAQKIKHYRVDKMGGICLNGKSRNGQTEFEHFDLAQYCNKTFNMYSGHDEMVTLQFDAALLGVILDRFGTDVTVRKRDACHFSVRVAVAVSGQFFGWLAGIGKGIQILAPGSVRQEYKNYLQSLICEVDNNED